MKAAWELTIAKKDFVVAVKHARTRATLRRKGSGFEPDVTLTKGPDGLSVRSSAAAMDIPASGVWNSPIMVHGATLRRLAPKLGGTEIMLCYVAGRLMLNGTSIPAREA